MILPSKKVLSIFILTVALVVAVIIAFGREKSSGVINSVNNLVAGEKISIPENPNWQNELGKTTANAELTQGEDGTSTQETTTDIVSRTFMSNYLALEQSGTLDDTSAQKLIDQTLDYIGKTSGSLNIETPKLNIVPDNGKQSIGEYGENLGMILKNNKPKKGAGDEFAILQEAMSKRDPKKIQELQGIVEFYEKMANEITKMPVPKTFVNAHTDIIIGTKAVILGLKEMKTVLDDPFRGLRGLQTYQEGGNLSFEAIKATLDFIKQNKIVYRQGTGGYYLLYGI